MEVTETLTEPIKKTIKIKGLPKELLARGEIPKLEALQSPLVESQRI